MALSEMVSDMRVNVMIAILFVSCAVSTHHPATDQKKKKESSDSKPRPPYRKMSREETRFLADIVARPLSTTVSRYRRLNLSRRRGNAVRESLNIDPGPSPRESFEHMFWVQRTAKYFEDKGYDVSCEHPAKGNGAVDVLAKRPGEMVAVEIETGKSNTKENLSKVSEAGFDRVVLVATSPAAITACRRATDSVKRTASSAIELLTWLDIS